MRLLFLAPQPFFMERGTPIAVRLALQVLANRKSAPTEPSSNRSPHQENIDKIDLLTYHEGAEVEIENVNIHRISAPRLLNGVGPGISVKKILCDILFLLKTIKMVWSQRHAQYDLVHAVEESVFVALLLRAFVGIPYIYDMDSSLAMQVTEKWYVLRPLRPVLEWFERLAVRHSTAVVPVCDALAVIAERHGSKETHILRDVSLLKDSHRTDAVSLRKEIGVAEDTKLIVYIGNLETYQGIDLLLDAFAAAASLDSGSHVVIIGGSEHHIQKYRAKAQQLGLSDRIHLIGPRPLKELDNYILQADILTSPRIKGNNTPMKIYSYLHSGKPILATNLPTHSQVMDRRVAEMSHVEPQAFADGLLRLLEDEGYCKQLGAAAKALAEREYTFSVFAKKLNQIYDRVGQRIELTPQIAQ